MSNWQFWIIAVALALNTVAMFVITDQLQDIRKLLDRINRGIWLDENRSRSMDKLRSDLPIRGDAAE